MSDPGAAWLTSMIRHGETAIALRQAGHTWGEIADALQLGDTRTAQRAAAMFIASDYETRRRTAGEPAGDTRPPPGPVGRLETEHTADGLR